MFRYLIIACLLASVSCKSSSVKRKQPTVNDIIDQIQDNNANSDSNNVDNNDNDDVSESDEHTVEAKNVVFYTDQQSLRIAGQTVLIGVDILYLDENEQDIFIDLHNDRLASYVTHVGDTYFFHYRVKSNEFTECLDSGNYTIHIDDSELNVSQNQTCLISIDTLEQEEEIDTSDVFVERISTIPQKAVLDENQTFLIQYEFSDDIEVTGEPYVMLFDHTHIAHYVASYDNVVLFQYRVQENEQASCVNVYDYYTVVTGGMSNITALNDPTRNISFQYSHEEPCWVSINTQEQRALALEQNYDNACVILQDHQLHCFGLNDYLQISDNHEISNIAYFLNVLPTKSFNHVSIGNGHICAIDTEQQLYCWGKNDRGQLADVGLLPKAPSDATPIFPDNQNDITWKFVSAGATHTCAIDTDDQLWCWGDGTFFQTGLNTHESIRTPQKIFTEELGWSSVSTGERHTCAVSLNHHLWCWGDNTYAQVTGENSIFSMIEEPVNIDDAGDVGSVSVGLYSTCYINLDHELYCFGVDSDYVNFQGDLDVENQSHVHIAPNIHFNQIEIEQDHACGTDIHSQLYCFGKSHNGSVGISGESKIFSPQVLGEWIDWSYADVSRNFSCALTYDGQLFCWGNNEEYPMMEFDEVYVPYLMSLPEQKTHVVDVFIDAESSVLKQGDKAYIHVTFSDDVFVFEDIQHRLPSLRLPNDIYATYVTSHDNVMIFEVEAPAGRVAECIDDPQSISFLNQGFVLSQGHILNDASFDLNSLESSCEVVIDTRSEDRAIRLMAGENHVCSLHADEHYECLGDNYYRLLTDSPVELYHEFEETSLLDGFEHVVYSARHACGIDSIHQVWCWGTNTYGQAGLCEEENCSFIEQPQIIEAPLGVTGFLDVVVGENYSCALTVEHDIYCWGQNNAGQIGNGLFDSDRHEAPNQIIHAYPGVQFSQISANLWNNHTCGITYNHEIYCWGANWSGQLGIGNSEDQGIPYQVQMPEDDHFSYVKVCQNYTLALDSHGYLYGWGINDSGIYADGTSNTSWIPTPAELNDNVRFESLACAYSYACGLTADHRTYCWGAQNDLGLLGNESQDLSWEPVLVHTNEKYIDLVAMNNFACGVTDFGKIQCWGKDVYVVNSNKPFSMNHVPMTQVHVIDFNENHILEPFENIRIQIEFEDAVEVEGTPTLSIDGYSREATYVGTFNGVVEFQYQLSEHDASRCFGDTTSYHLNISENDTISSVNFPYNSVQTTFIQSDDVCNWDVSNQNDIFNIEQVSMSGSNMCVINSANALYCWGQNYYGQVGDGTRLDREEPSSVVGNQAWSAVSVGSSHACAIDRLHDMYCWGSNQYGQLGLGQGYHPNSFDYESEPQLVTGEHVWEQVEVGLSHSCGITTDHALYCWGYNGEGQLGNALAQQDIPTLVALDAQWSQVSAGWRNTCAITLQDQLYCWGSNWYHILGDGSDVENATEPSLVLTPEGVDGWMDVDVGDVHICAVDLEHRAYCWGRNNSAQLGTGDTEDSSIPTLVAFQNDVVVNDISANAYDTCALTQGQQLWCWGDTRAASNEDNIRSFISKRPERIGASQDWIGITSGGFDHCAVNDVSNLYCWGNNNQNKFFTDQLTWTQEPTHVWLPKTSRAYIESVNVESESNEVQVDDIVRIYVHFSEDVNIDGDISLLIDGEKTAELVGHQGNVLIFEYTASEGDFFECLDSGENIHVVVSEGHIQTNDDHTDAILIIPSNEALCSISVNALPAAEVLSISAGIAHTCAVKSDHTLWCWGANFEGEIGVYPTLSIPIPTQVSPDTDWIQVQTTGAGGERTCGLKQDHSVVCWGWGDEEYDLTLEDFNEAPTTDDGWQSIANGLLHSCGINTQGLLYCWGDNSLGQLGQGYFDVYVENAVFFYTQSNPIPLLLDNTRWLQVSMSNIGNQQAEHACAVRGDGSVWCWGSNRYGQLGNGTFMDASEPVRVIHPSETIFISVAVDAQSSCALDVYANLYCWGANFGTEGIFVRNMHVATPSPVFTAGWGFPYLSSISQMKMNSDALCFLGNGLHEEGLEGNFTLSCLGRNFERIDADSEALWKQFSMSFYDDAWILGVKSDGTLWRWSWDNNFQNFGYDAEAYQLILTSDGNEEDENDWFMTAITLNHACALQLDGHLQCWGANDYGQLGIGPNQFWGFDFENASFLPGDDWAFVTVSNNSTCAIQKDHSLWCWGQNTGTTQPIHMYPTRKFRSVSITDHSLVGITLSGELVRAGFVDTQNNTQTVVTTLQNIEASSDMLRYSRHENTDHFCYVDQFNQLYCWGEGASGQLGYETEQVQEVPVLVNHMNWNIVEVAVNGDHTCGLSFYDHQLWCWGANSEGQLGCDLDVDTPGYQNVFQPTIMSIEPVVDVALGSQFTCFVQGEGTVWCVGKMDNTTWGTTPTQVHVDNLYYSIQAGSDHMCVLNVDTGLFCMGDNSNYQLGQGHTNDSSVLVQVPYAGGIGEWLEFTPPPSGVSELNNTCLLDSLYRTWCFGATTGQMPTLYEP